jgi:hypothetical protein
MIGEALRRGRIVRATDFRTEARDPIVLTKTAKTATTRVIGTIDTDGTIAPGISGPIAIPSRRANNLQQMLPLRPGFPPS